MAAVALSLALVGMAQAGAAAPSAAALATLRHEIATGQLAAARRQLRAWQAAFPADPRLHDAAGLLALRQGDLAGAAGEFRQAAALAPHDHSIALHLGQTLWAGHDTSGARAVFAQLLRADPENPSANLVWGEIQFAGGDCGAALPAFARAGAALTAQPAAALMAAVCGLRLGQPTQAEGFLQPLPSPAAVPPGAALELTEAADRAGADGLARAAFRLLPRDYPDPATHAYDGALLALRNGDAPAAVRMLRSRAARGGDSAELENLLGTAYERQITAGPAAPPLVQRAYNAYRRGMQLDPRAAANFLDAGRLMMKFNQFALAEQVLGAGVAANPRAWPLYLERGIAYAFSGHAAAAAGDLRQAQDLAPGDPMPYLAQGLLALQQGQYSAAAAVLRAGLADAGAAAPRALATPPRAWLNYLLADALYRMVNRDAAQTAEMRRASAESLRLAPRFADAYALAGRIALADHDARQARVALAAAHRLAPQDPKYLYQLARADRALDPSRARVEFATFEHLEKTYDPARVRKYFLRIFAQPAVQPLPVASPAS